MAETSESDRKLKNNMSLHYKLYSRKASLKKYRELKFYIFFSFCFIVLTVLTINTGLHCLSHLYGSQDYRKKTSEETENRF